MALVALNSLNPDDELSQSVERTMGTEGNRVVVTILSDDHKSLRQSTTGLIEMLTLVENVVEANKKIRFS